MQQLFMLYSLGSFSWRNSKCIISMDYWRCCKFLAIHNRMSLVQVITKLPEPLLTLKYALPFSDGWIFCSSFPMQIKDCLFRSYYTEVNSDCLYIYFI